MLTGCVLSVRWIVSLPYFRSQATLSKLKEVTEGLPPLPDSELLDEHGQATTSSITACVGAAVDRLYGANDESFASILIRYTTALERQGWRVRHGDDTGKSFDKAETVFMSVYPLPADPTFDPEFNEAVVRARLQKYKTLIHVQLYMPNDPVDWANNCGLGY